MGDPKFSRRKFERPTHPWIADRITEERAIGKKYGLKNKRELWKVQSFLRQCRAQARSLQAKLRLENEQAKKETSLLLRRLIRLGVLKEGTGSVDDVLGLNLDMVMGRRFESIVFYKGLASSPKQARQFITHGHITIKGRRVTIPGYLVKKEEEDKIAYHPRSPFMDPAHPLRKPPEEVEEKKETKVLKEVLKEATDGAKEAVKEDKPKEEGVEEKKPEEKKKEEKKKPEEAKHEEKKKHQEEKKEKKGDEK